MLIISQAKVTVRKPGEVRVEGTFLRHRVKIEHFLAELGLENATIRLRSGQLIFSRNVDPSLHQLLRNFFVNECSP